VIAFTVERSESGGPCTATAFVHSDHRVAVQPVSCSDTSWAIITVTEASGRISYQFVGPHLPVAYLNAGRGSGETDHLHSRPFAAFSGIPQGTEFWTVSWAWYLPSRLTSVKSR